MNTINEAHNEVKERLVKALDDAKHRMLLLDLLSKHPGSYEALIAFAEECEPVYNGNREVFEFALDELAPEIDEDGRLSFEIPYSRYAWNAEANAWRIVEEDDKSHAVAAKRTHARALPLVRYEVDAEEERLRDAVVEAADRWESEATPLYLVPSAAKELESAVRALRAHREKVGR